MSTISIQYSNFYKLNTKEDSSYFHKGLGTLCLFHFIYRYSLFFLYGNMFIFKPMDIFLVNLHGVLSISSFIFHIPNLRNSLKPMIYPEFRLHSILFAFRSVIICNIYYQNLSFLYIIGTCFGTMIGADIITSIYNMEGKNGKTMRNMPFEKSIPENLQKDITKMHSIMQIGATSFMLGTIDTAFSPLFAIQLAAFLMTLVRKSIISTSTWHAIYSLSLWINFGFFTTLSCEYILLQQIMIHSFKHFFFPNKINKYIAWSLLFGLFSFYKYFIQELNILNWIDQYFFIFYLKKMMVFIIWTYYLNKFKPLFIN
jgi:hypothetical protein